MYATGTLPLQTHTSMPAQSVGTSSPSPDPDRRREISFEEARKSPSLREAFVDQYASRMVLPPYVKSVRYDPRQQHPHKEGIADDVFFQTSVQGDDLLQRSSKLESKIKVLDTAFTLRSEAEFRAGWEYHELTHAKDFWDGFDFIPDSAFYVKFQGKRTFYDSFHRAVLELHAVQEQFNRSMADENLYSRRYLQELSAFWMDNYRDLWRVDPALADTSSLRVRFFNDMMGNPPQRLVKDLPGFSSRYCITLAPDVKKEHYSPEGWRLSNIAIDLPAGLDQRIDAFYDEYVRRGFHYQTPEFDSFVRKTTPDQLEGGK